MSATVNAKTYALYSPSPNLVGYAGPGHTASVKDRLNIGRTAAKPNSVFSGVTRADVKLTRTSTLTGALTPTADAILEIKSSIPVGMASADIDVILNDMGAYLASAEFKDIVKKSQINF